MTCQIGALRPRRAAATEPTDTETSAEAAESVRRRPFGAYLQVLGLTLLNPLTVIYFSVLVLGLHNGRAWSAAAAAVFVLAAFAASACWQSVLALGGALIGRALTGARGRLV